MTQQRFHADVSLVAGAKLVNANFEVFANDPAVVRAGRIWQNSTSGRFKYSVLDGQGALVVKSFATYEDMSADIADLQTALNNEISARQTAITTEQQARLNAVSTLTTALSAEVAARTVADSDEQQARIDGIATEAAARTAAIAVAAATAANATSTETAARLSGDAAQTARSTDIQAELDLVEASAGLNIDGTYTAPENTTYLEGVETLKAADVALDLAISNEVAARITVAGALQSALNNEAQLRSDGDANLQSQLQAWVNTQIAADNITDAAKLAVESANRIAAISALQTELDTTQASIGLNANGSSAPIVGTNYLDGTTTVFGGAFALDVAIKSVADAVAAEGVARATADSNFHDQLQQEVTDRATADSAIQQELNTTQAGAGLETTGAYVAGTNSNYLGSATNLKDADSKLDAALKAVSNRVGIVETVSVPGLQSQITDEITARTAAVSNEANARAQDVTTLTTAVSNEVTRATTREDAIAARVTSEVTRASGVENNLQSQIAALAAASGEGAAALKTALNSDRFTYLSSDAKLEHVVTHNLNTDFYSLNVMVKAEGGSWVNDVVPVQDIDKNSFKVTLGEAMYLKASGQSNSQIA